MATAQRLRPRWRWREKHRAKRGQEKFVCNSESLRTEHAPESPSVKELLLAVASIGVPGLLNACIEPCTSFAETASVGQVGGASALAAFSPGGAFFSTAEELSATLGVAVASAVSARAENPFAQTRLIRTLLLCSALCGILVCIPTCAFGFDIAFALGADSGLLSLSREYIVIRSIAIPGFLVAMTSEGALVGANRPWVPLRVYAFSGALNLACLGLFIKFMNIEPLRAVALSAVAAHCTSGFVMASRLRTYSLVQQVSDTAQSWLGHRELLSFLRLAGSMLVGAIGRVLVFCAITVAVNKAGVIPAAAHKLAQETYWLLGCFTEPLFVSVAALVPRYRASHPDFARKLAVTSMSIALAVGAMLVLPAYILVCTPFFTQDLTVLSELSTVAPHVGASLMLASLVYTLEGILVGIEDVSHLTNTHVINAVLVCGATAACFSVGNGLTLARGWLMMVSYLSLRLVQHTYRLIVMINPFSTLVGSESDGGVGTVPEKQQLDTAIAGNGTLIDGTSVDMEDRAVDAG